MLAKHPYDLVHDSTPLIYATVQPFFLIVYPSLPTRTVREVIALAKAEQACPAARSRSGTLAADGAAAVGGPPERFGTRVKIEVEKYRKLVKQIGLETE